MLRTWRMVRAFLSKSLSWKVAIGAGMNACSRVESSWSGGYYRTSLGAMIERAARIGLAQHGLEGRLLTMRIPAFEPPLGIEPSPSPYQGDAPPWSYDGEKGSGRTR